MSADERTDSMVQILLRLDAIEARLEALEAERTLPVARRSAAARGVGNPEPLEIGPEPIPEPAPEAVSALSQTSVAEPDRPELETQVGLTWLNRIGVLTVILGVAFFFKYAVDRGLIGEVGRVVLGIAIGFGALGFAELMWRRGHRIYAQGITGAGIAILYLSLYAAFAFYHLLPQPVAALLLFFTTVMAVALALRYNAIAIAALGLIGGYLTPLLLSTNEDHPWTLFAYLLILAAGGMSLVRRMGWRYLEPLVLGGTSLVYVSWYWNHFGNGKEFAATFFILALYALYWQWGSLGGLIAAQILAPLAIAAVWSGPESQSLWTVLLLGGAGLLASRRRSTPALSLLAFFLFYVAAIGWRRHPFPQVPILGLTALTAGFLLFLGFVIWVLISEWDTQVESAGSSETPDPYLTILAMNGLIYFAFCYSLLDQQFHAYLGALAALIAGVHLFAARRLWKELPADFEGWVLASGAARPIYLLLGVAITFLTIAIPIQFSEYRITMWWALEAAAFTWLAARTGHQRFGAAGAVIFALAIVRVYLFDAWMYRAGIPHTLLFNARLLTFLITGVCLWLSAYWVRKGTAALILYVAGHAVALTALMMETLDWAARRSAAGDLTSVGTLSASVLLALYGVGLVSFGVSRRSLIDRILGLGLLALVVLKLYFYDVWQLQQSFRVVAFVGLGVLLLIASFVYSRFRAVLEKLLSGEGA